MDQRPRVARKGALVFISFFFLLITIWLFLVSMAAFSKTSVYAAGVTSIQETPTVDLTVTVLAKQKLNQEVNQLELQNDRSPSEWLWNNASTLFSVLIVVGSAIFGLYKWVKDRGTEREKASEERFQSVGDGLGGERTEMKVGGAIVLRTFLLPGYEQFYRQVFDLAVAHLRLQPHASSERSQPAHSMGQAIATLFVAASVRSQKEVTLDASKSPDPLSQALATVFKESFPLIREWLKQGGSPPRLLSIQGILMRLRIRKRVSLFRPQLLDATSVQLRKAHLSMADFKEIWMAESHLEEADLISAEFYKANLAGTNLAGAHLERADLRGTNLIGTVFTNAFLDGAYFEKSVLENTRFDRADLKRAHFAGSTLRKCSFTGADLTEADFTGVKLSETNLLDAKSLARTKIHDITTLTEEQVGAYRTAGASVGNAAQIAHQAAKSSAR